MTSASKIDPILSRGQMARPIHSAYGSLIAPSGRLSPGEDPLSAAPSWAGTAAPKANALLRQTSIAVFLKSSQSRAQAFSRARAKNEAGAADLATSDPSSRAHKQTPSTKQTPVPLPVQVGASTTASPSFGASVSQGRPRGWRPGMSYSGMLGNPGKPAKARLITAAAARSARHVKPKPPPSGNAKRRRRPPKAPSPQPRQVYGALDTPFVAFLCEWEGCKAELHNLATLRRHVYAVHSYDGPTVCQWGKCGKRSSHDAFPDVQTFRAHVEEAHLVPLSWHIGDGPQNKSGYATSGGEETPDYLKDAEGNQVTPSIRDQEVEDFATWKLNRQKLKDLLMRMNDNLPSEESDTPGDGE